MIQTQCSKLLDLEHGHRYLHILTINFCYHPIVFSIYLEMNKVDKKQHESTVQKIQTHKKATTRFLTNLKLYFSYL